MKASQRTAGATLIVTVLIVMLVMAAILAVTAQFSLATRRSSTDQDNTLRAQYAAESGVARSQATLNLLNALMANDLVIPANVGGSEVAAKVAALCGPGVTLPESGPLCGPSTPTGSSPSVLGSTADLLANSGRLSLFTDYIPDTAYAPRGWTLGSTSSTNEQGFWASALGSAGLGGNGAAGSQSFSSAARIKVVGVQKLGNDQYIVYFSVPSVQAQGGDGASTRALTVNSVNNLYTLQIGRGSFAKYALFTNHHFSAASAEGSGNRIVMTSNTRFSGPVHTNQNLTLIGSPYFGGQVTSAGCPANQIKDDQSGCKVSATPGAYGNNNFYTPSQMTGTPPNVTLGTDASPQFQGGVNWNNDFVPLPKNGNDQVAAAKSGGLYIPGQVGNLSLSVTNLPLGGATVKAQTISYQQQVGGVTVTVSLAYGPDGRMFIQAAGGAYVPAARAVDGSGLPTGTWVAAAAGLPAATFNGVIYAQSGIGNLRGPARTNAGDPATAPAAVADFAQLTLASDGDISITSDLKYENPPCTAGDAATAVCNNTSAKNILGIYSAGGDVKIVNQYTATGIRAPAAPRDVTIHAVLMAAGKEGKVTVDGFDAGPTDATDRGKVNLLGGIIENYYGAFGLTNGRGYGRNFVYDTRTGDGIAPPSFPTQKAWEVSIPVNQRLQLQGSSTQQAKP